VAPQIPVTTLTTLDLLITLDPLITLDLLITLTPLITLDRTCRSR
jgi:hypothetical protein